MKPDKLILDVNIWVSYILQKRLGDLTVLIIQYDLLIYISPSLLIELEDVLQRPKISKYLTLDPQEYLNYVSSVTTLITPVQSFTSAPDPKDNFLFELGITAGATHLVTGDKLLLERVEIAGIKIINFKAFRALYGGE